VDGADIARAQVANFQGFMSMESDRIQLLPADHIIDVGLE
jgi:hypothetical protein